MMDLFQTGYLQLEDHLRAGGVVMLPLALISLVMWVLIIDRAFFFRRLHHKNMGTLEVFEHISADRMPDPQKFKGAVFLLVAQFLSLRSGDRDLDRFILDETLLKMNRSLTEYLPLIGVLAAIAPFLGLLGTVTGLISTFEVLSVFGTGNAKAMAGGISEALITTQTGLLVAVPGFYMKGFLDRRARKLQQHIAVVGNYLKRHLC